jgi:hypothetical protein
MTTEFSLEAPDVEQAEAEQTDSRQRESKRTKLSVLIGSGIIQLPIWGMLDHMSRLPLYLLSSRLCCELRSLPGILL